MIGYPPVRQIHEAVAWISGAHGVDRDMDLFEGAEVVGNEYLLDTVGLSFVRNGS